MNRPIQIRSLIAGLSSLACAFAITAAEPEGNDRNQRNQNRDSTRDDKSSGRSEQYGQDKDKDQNPQSFVRHALLGGMKEVRVNQLALQRSDNSQIKSFAQRMIDDHSKVNNELMQLAQRKGWAMPATNAYDMPGGSTDSASSPARDGRSKTGDVTAADRNRTDKADASGTERSRRDYSSDRNTRGNHVSDRQDNTARWDHLQMEGRMSIENLKNLPTGEFDKAYVKQTLKDHASSVKKFQEASMHNTDEEVRMFAKNTLPQLQDHQRQAKQLAQDLGISWDQDKEPKTSTSDFERPGKNK